MKVHRFEVYCPFIALVTNGNTNNGITIYQMRELVEDEIMIYDGKRQSGPKGIESPYGLTPYEPLEGAPPIREKICRPNLV